MARKREDGSNDKQEKSAGVSQNTTDTACRGKSKSSSTISKTAVHSKTPIYQSLKDQLATLGLALREIPGDGNCLFGALADQIDGCRDTHFKHRQEIVAYIQKHQCHFEPFMEDDMSFTDHVRRLSELGTFGGNECMVAFARIHNVIVVIHQLNLVPYIIHGQESSEDSSLPSHPNSEVHVSYHNGDHYNSVRRMGDYSCAPAKVVRMLKGSQSVNRHETKKLEIKLMQYTGCTDYLLAKKFLETHNDNLERATEALIAALHDEDLDANTSQDYDDDDDGKTIMGASKPTSLWSEGGTGVRVLGSGAAQIALENSTYPPSSRERSSVGDINKRTRNVEKMQDKLKHERLLSKRQRNERKKQKNSDRKKGAILTDEENESLPEIQCLRI